MKRSEVKSFIKAGVTAVNPDLSFGSGRITEFNSDLAKLSPAVWLESLEVDTELNDSRPFDGWKIVLHIAKKDTIDSSYSQYEDIIDEADYIAQQLIKQYNDLISGYSLVTITSINRTPFIKQHAECLTGVILSFTLNDLDQTELC